MADQQASPEQVSFTLSSEKKLKEPLEISGDPDKSVYECISDHSKLENRMKKWPLSRMFLLDNDKGLLNMGSPISFVSGRKLEAKFVHGNVSNVICVRRNIPGGTLAGVFYVKKAKGLIPNKFDESKICVPFLLKETLLEALFKDGRFNRDSDKLGACEVKLNNGEHRKISNPHKTNASIYKDKEIEVSVDRRRARDISDEDYKDWIEVCQGNADVGNQKEERQDKEVPAEPTPSTSQAGPTGDVTIKKEEPEYEPTDEQKRIVQNMQEQVEEQKLVFIDIYIKILNSDIKGSRKLLNGSTRNKKFSLGNNKDRKKVLRIATENFRKDYKSHITSSLMRRLCTIQEFVGAVLVPDRRSADAYIQVGTALYLGSNYILTCWHVLQGIYGESIEIGPLEENKEAILYFGDTYFNFDWGCCANMHDIVAGDSAEKSSLDYAIVRVGNFERGKDVTDETWKILNSPEQDCLEFDFLGDKSGYESNKPQNDEDYTRQCHLIGWPDRLDEAPNIMRQVDIGCTIVPRADEDYNLYLYNIRKEPDEGKRPKPAEHVHYKSNFFQAASGSPVVDQFGRVIAMHRMGYPFKDSGSDYKLEIGVLIERIAKHLFDSKLDDDYLSRLFAIFHKIKNEEPSILTPPPTPPMHS